MTTVSILTVSTHQGGVVYHAVSGDHRSEGRTAGEALDGLSGQFARDEAGTFVVVQRRLPDEFFSAEQQRRLEELMAKWRVARDIGSQLSVQEQTELNALVETELRAATDRTAALVVEQRL